MRNSEAPSIEAANDTALAINNWLMEHPTVDSEEMARDAKALLDRGSLSIDDMEDERTAKVGPLNKQVKDINNIYRDPREAMDRLLHELYVRMTKFMQAEQEKKRAALEEAVREKARAELAARDAEKAEQERLADAASGELDVDVAALTAEADAKFGEYEAASRAAALAEKETKVKIGGGFRRAIGLKKKETLKVVDLMEVFDEIEMTEGIEAEIIKAAKAFRKLNSRLPKGIEATITEGM